MPNEDPKHAARAAAELKETEDLLAGFDRTGRSPRTPAVQQRDFVDYHLRRDRAEPAPEEPKPADPPTAPRGKRAVSTFVIARREFPSWVLWAALLLLMPIGGVIVAYAVVDRPSPAPSATTAPSAPPPLSAAPIAAPPETSSSSEVPLPAPAPSATEAPARTAPVRPHAPASAAPAKADAASDFIRHL